MKTAKGRPAEAGELIKRRFRLSWPYIRPGDTLLDYGCGNNVQGDIFRNMGYVVDGIDIDNLHSYDEEVFERILCFDVLEHVDDEVYTLGHIYDLLMSRGHLIMTVPNKWWIFETHGFWCSRGWNRVPFMSWLPRFIHDRLAKARIYTKRSIIDLLTECNFNVVDVKYLKAPMDVTKSKILKWLFRKDTTKIPFLATAIFVVAEKS